VLNARRTELDRFAKQSERYQYGHEAEALRKLDIGDAQNLVIIVGGEGLDRAGHAALMHTAADILISSGHAGKRNSGLLAVWPGANTQGAFDLGYTSEATEAILGQRPEVLFLADADVVGEDALSASLLQSGFTVVSDLFLTETAALADVVLPRQSFAERDGSFTNGERRVQRFYTAQTPLPGTRPDWKFFGEINALLGRGKSRLSAAAVMHDITRNVPRYAQMSYPNLAHVEPQFPDVGGSDLYYGGTAYDNRGGLGVQWPVEAEQGAVTLDGQGKQAARKIRKGELLIVPIVELYDRKPTFRASEHLMHAHIPAPYVVLNADDAQKMDIADGDIVSVAYGAQAVEVKARVDLAAPAGAALLPRNLSDRPAPAIPVSGTVRKVEVMANV
jgi:NADH-quinone oxidoreductase subunit G